MSTRTKRPQSSPSARKKTAARGSQRPAPRQTTDNTPAGRNHDKYLAGLADHPDCRELVEAIREAPDHPKARTLIDELARNELDEELSRLLKSRRTTDRQTAAKIGRGKIKKALEQLQRSRPKTATAEEADRARQHDARRAIENMLETLRTRYEPDPADIARLAELVSAAADHLRAAAASPSAGPMLDKALVPAACAAVTLADVVNGPCLEHASQDHADARAKAERWPRIHYANGTRNAKADKVFCTFGIGSRSAHRTAKQARPTPASLAFDRTLDALRLLLPDALRPDVFPVFPLLLDRTGQPIPPRTAEGELAAPYRALARFLVTVRHTPEDFTIARDEALRAFLAANDTAAERQTPAVRTAYNRTRRRLVALVRDLHEDASKPVPEWLRPSAPECIGSRTSKDRSCILRTERLQILAAYLLPVYSLTVAENDARAALKALVALRYEVTGKGITGPKSPARDYVAPLLVTLGRLRELTEPELRAIAQSARADAGRLKP